MEMMKELKFKATLEVENDRFAALKKKIDFNINGAVVGDLHKFKGRRVEKTKREVW